MLECPLGQFKRAKHGVLPCAAAKLLYRSGVVGGLSGPPGLSGAVYAFLVGGGVYTIAFVIALLVWLGREAIWWRGSGHRGGLIKEFWGSNDSARNRRPKK